MEDIKVLVYIVFAVIWVIGRVVKNRKKQLNKQENPKERNDPPKKEVSFDDLLKEFTQNSQEEPETKKEPEIQYEQPIQYEKPVIEDNSWHGSDEEVASTYARSIKEAENVDMKEKGHNHYLKRFEVFEEAEENLFLANLNNELHEERGLKKAMIYKEILDRKHF